MKLILHHTGCAVSSIEESLAWYRVAFGEDKISEKIYISSQSVYVCFVETAPGVYLELIEPADEQSFVYRLLKKHISYYHTAYTIDNIDDSIIVLENQGCKLVSVFNSEAFDNKRCAFLYLPDGCLVELIEN